MAARFLVIAALFACAIASGDSKVLDLTEDTFDSTIAANKLTLVEFFAPWCGHCKALEPEYNAAAKKLEEQNFADGKLAKVDCTTQRSLCDKNGVRGFPTVKLFRNDGSKPSEFDAERKADSIVKFMVKQNQPAVTELTAGGVAGFAPSDSIKIIAFVEDASNDEVFNKVASALRKEYAFGIVRGAAKNAVRMYRDFDEGNVELAEFPLTEDALTTWINTHSFPIVGTIGPENYQKYVQRGLDFVWVFIDTKSKEDNDLIKDVVTPVAKDFGAKLSFVKLDGIKWSEHAKNFGLSGSTPGIAIEDRDTPPKKAGKNYVFSETSVTADNFRDFIKSYVDGKLQPHLKSEAVPADNSGPVKVIVGTTFNEIVMDNEKDVLVEFYAPWCGHCKQLAPKYEEIGKQFPASSNIVIAKVDATANDVPADVQGYPTLIFYPAGDKSNPLTYEGDRTVADISSWVREHSKAKPAAAGESKDL